MIKVILFFLLFIIPLNNIDASEVKLQEIFKGLQSPWSLSFIDNENVILTEKSGNLLHINLIEKKIKKINHNLDILEDGQGGLLDVLYKDQNIYVSYSENRGNYNSSTSVAKGKFNIDIITFKNIFRAEPPIKSGYHFGSRLAVKDNHLYVTAGERGKGMIAQDPTKHPGSIIRINLDGSIPKDNPKFNNKKNGYQKYIKLALETLKVWLYLLLTIKFILPIMEREVETGLAVLTTEKTMVGKY